jgi:Cu(I)/Ag(I) efflux system membrane fusion protein
MMKFDNKSLFLGGGIALLLCLLGYFFTRPIFSNNVTDTETSTIRKPLYWVAPMDPNYRRDQPGNSPMGMALVPVFADQQDNQLAQEEGTIQIAAHVINNLGVRLATVEYKSLQPKINTVGFVSYDEDRLIHIHPRVAGWVEKLYVQAIGDEVEKDQPLYDIYSPEVVNAQQELLLALDGKNKHLITAAENRLTTLGLSADALIQLKQSRIIKQSITLYAPQSGVIKSLTVRDGFYVKPDTMMLSIVDLAYVWVKAELFERQVPDVAIGDEVMMAVDYLANKQWSGHIDHIHPMINAKTRTNVVRLRFKNDDGVLKPNMLAYVSIDTDDHQPTIVIPKEALIRTGKQDRVVLALGEGAFKSIEVTVGRFDRDFAEILSGVAVGEKVVSSAQFLLDSESSKNSDFSRMAPIELNHSSVASDDHSNHSMSGMIKGKPTNSARVNGTINSLMPAHRMVNISRDAIEKWQRPAATLDFYVSKDIDMSILAQHMLVAFTFEVNDGEFIITAITPIKKHVMNNKNQAIRE